jgi:hypothetical protein
VKDGGKTRRDYDTRLAAMETGESMALALLEERRAMASAEELEIQRKREEEARLAREEEERLAAEAEQARRREAELAERMALEAEEARAREVEERRSREAEEAERLARDERERLDAEEEARRREEDERLAASEAEREALEAEARRQEQLAQQERLAREEEERRSREQSEQERLASEEQEQRERELAELRRQDEERAEQERVRRAAEEAERLARDEQEGLDERAEQERAEQERREAEEAQRLAEEDQARKDREWDQARDRMEGQQELDRADEEARRRELEQQRGAADTDLAGFRRHRLYLAAGGGGASITRLTADGSEGEVGWTAGGEVGYLIPVKERGVAIGIGLSYANLPVSGCSRAQTRGSVAALHVGPRVPVHLGRRAWLSIRGGLHVGAAGTWPGSAARTACAGNDGDSGVLYGLRLADSTTGAEARISYAEVGWRGYAVAFGPDLEVGAMFGAGKGSSYLGVAGFIRHDQLFAVVRGDTYYFKAEGNTSADLGSESISGMDGKASMARFQFGLRGVVMF